VGESLGVGLGVGFFVCVGPGLGLGVLFDVGPRVGPKEEGPGIRVD
jgi:hypothetical protein